MLWYSTRDILAMALQTGTYIIYLSRALLVLKDVGWAYQPSNVWCPSRPAVCWFWRDCRCGTSRTGAPDQEVQDCDNHACGHFNRCAGVSVSLLGHFRLSLPFRRAFGPSGGGRCRETGLPRNARRSRRRLRSRKRGDPDGQLGYRRRHYRQSEGPRRAPRT